MFKFLAILFAVVRPSTALIANLGNIPKLSAPIHFVVQNGAIVNFEGHIITSESDQTVQYSTDNLTSINTMFGLSLPGKGNQMCNIAGAYLPSRYFTYPYFQLGPVEGDPETFLFPCGNNAGFTIQCDDPFSKCDYIYAENSRTKQP